MQKNPAKVILIIYTTKYRLGGHQFPVVAETLAAEKRDGGFEGEIVTRAVGELCYPAFIERLSLSTTSRLSSASHSRYRA